MLEGTKPLTAGDIDFSSSPLFRKTVAVLSCNVAFARGGELVVTKQRSFDGLEFEETRKTAKKGDAIVSRTANDVYVIDKEKFLKLYEQRDDYYVSRNTGVAKFLTRDTIFRPAWGGSQLIEAGGVIFRNEESGEVYGNQAQSFEMDFSRVSRSGDLLPLSASLEDQLAWAIDTKSGLHRADIEQRLRFHRNNRAVK